MPPPTRYSLRERLYFGAVIAAGCSIAGKSAAEVVLAQLPSEWLILGALTLLTGFIAPRFELRSLFLAGAVCWMLIDPRRPVFGAEPRTLEPQPAGAPTNAR